MFLKNNLNIFTAYNFTGITTNIFYFPFFLQVPVKVSYVLKHFLSFAFSF